MGSFPPCREVCLRPLNELPGWWLLVRKRGRVLPPRDPFLLVIHPHFPFQFFRRFHHRQRVRVRRRARSGKCILDNLLPHRRHHSPFRRLLPPPQYQDKIISLPSRHMLKIHTLLHKCKRHHTLKLQPNNRVNRPNNRNNSNLNLVPPRKASNIPTLKKQEE